MRFCVCAGPAGRAMIWRVAPDADEPVDIFEEQQGDGWSRLSPDEPSTPESTDAWLTAETGPDGYIVPRGSKCPRSFVLKKGSAVKVIQLVVAATKGSGRELRARCLVSLGAATFELVIPVARLRFDG